VHGSTRQTDYQQVLRTVTYDNHHSAPNPETRVIKFVANDVTDNSLIAATHLAISTNVGVLVVTNSSDSVDTINGSTTTFSIDDLIASPGADGISLREAIIASNNTDNGLGGPDVIRFDINGPGLHTINLSSALPEITQTTIIDGTSNGTPSIELKGTNAGDGAIGLKLAVGSDNSAVRGLIITSFSGNGIEVHSSNSIIAGNIIGTDGGNTKGIGNLNGIVVSGNHNFVGGLTDADRNIISGNNESGIVINAGATQTQVKGNYIGTNIAGDAALKNNDFGI
jgi:hypothetical protein